MRFYNQQGANLLRTNLAESDNICDCCQQFAHEAREYMPDDIECPDCGKLCKCACHRPAKPAVAA